MSFNIQELDHHHLQNRVVDVGVNHGVIRSYDCVFCRRGFTTAQALGGHMNIHRKDRATTTTTTLNRPSTNNSTITVDRSKEIMLLEDDDNDNDNDQVNTTTRLFFSSKSYFSSSQCHSNGGRSGVEGGLLSRVQDHGHREEEVDLELRLGHYPW
ncbi:hypothetical protein vseg_003251 [Gypsophila vaccaria]